MIIIGGEEDILVSHLTSFRYIDVEGEIIETPFQSFEAVNVLTVQQVPESPNPELSMASWKGAKAIIETGNAQGWGKLIEVREKWDKFGLGYEPSSDRKNNQLNKKQIPPIEETFSSPDHIFVNQITMIKDEAYNEVVSI